MHVALWRCNEANQYDWELHSAKICCTKAFRENGGYLEQNTSRTLEDLEFFFGDRKLEWKDVTNQDLAQQIPTVVFKTLEDHEYLA